MNSKANAVLSCFGVFTVFCFLGCSTVDSRIQKSADKFSNYPADVQQKIKSGTVDVGFTEEMVRIALGAPDRVSNRVSSGETPVTVWGYVDHGPHFSVGMGAGGGGRSGGVGAGVVASDTANPYAEKTRVVFRDGVVVSIERTTAR